MFGPAPPPPHALLGIRIAGLASSGAREARSQTTYRSMRRQSLPAWAAPPAGRRRRASGYGVLRTYAINSSFGPPRQFGLCPVSFVTASAVARFKRRDGEGGWGACEGPAPSVEGPRKERGSHLER